MQPQNTTWGAAISRWLLSSSTSCQVLGRCGPREVRDISFAGKDVMTILLLSCAGERDTRLAGRHLTDRFRQLQARGSASLPGVQDYSTHLNMRSRPCCSSFPKCFGGVPHFTLFASDEEPFKSRIKSYDVQSAPLLIYTSYVHDHASTSAHVLPLHGSAGESCRLA